MRGKFEIEKVLHEIIRDLPKAQEIERKYTQGYITADTALTEIARIFRVENGTIIEGDMVYTPRFCTVKIDRVFTDKETAVRNGYKEETHYHKNGYGILGRSIDMYHMEFAAHYE